MSDLPTNALLTPRECGTLLGIGARTLANWRCEGFGPPFSKVGSRVRYRKEDVDAWVASRRFVSTSGYHMRRLPSVGLATPKHNKR